MLANEFKINECDKCFYIKDTPNHKVIVCFYVDDMLIIKRDISDVNATKHMLESNFDMKDIEVTDVIEKVLDKFKYLDFNIVKTPINVRFVLQKNEGKSDSQLDCARVLRSMIYIMKCTRSDIAYAINKLSRFTSNLNQTHWMTMKRVLEYLKHT